MSVTNFEDLQIWKRSSRLAADILKVAQDWKLWPLRDQVCRSAISVPSNIAEGCERDSNPDIIRFFRIAKGSLAELQTQLYLASELDLIISIQRKQWIEESKEIAAMTQSLIFHYSEKRDK